MIDDPVAVTFTASADHATLSRYDLRAVVEATGAPLSPISLGLPTPDAGVITQPLYTSLWEDGVEYRVQVRSVRGSSASSWASSASTGRVTVPVPPVEEGDYYVATSGSDSNPGSLASPFRTVGKGVSVLGPGKTLVVRAGTYAESLVNNVPGGTSWTNKVRLVAYAGETVWLKPNAGATRVVSFSQSSRQYIELDGINLDGTNVTYDIVKIEGWSGGNAHHIRIKNAELKGSAINNGQHRQHVLATAAVAGVVGNNEFINLTLHGHGWDDFDHGFYVQSSNNLIDGCTLYDIAGAGVHFYSAYGHLFSDNIVRNTVVRDGRLGGTGQRGWGILSASNSQRTKIYNNLVYNIRNVGSPSAGIYLGLSNASGAEVYNNTVYGNASYGVRIDSPYLGATVRNTISYGNATNYANSGISTAADHNLFGTNPLFVNAAAGDFHLQAGSPARNAGATIAAVTTDIAGTSRPQESAYDIGAYEYVP